MDLSTWRTRTGVEVDFVLYGPDGFWAIEAKNNSRVRPEDLRGLRTFHGDYPEARPVLLYRGDRRVQRGAVLCLPVEEFLADLRPGGDLV